jgi:enamine deaminase RidA (YjgF/YER057c/UK114 family)
MSVTRIQAGPRMSQAVVYGKTVYLAGQVATNPVPSVEKQMRQITQTIDKLLKAAGTSKKHLLTANVWLADIRTFDQMNKVWDAWVDPNGTPARATVEAKLARADLLVEVMVTAAIP